MGQQARNPHWVQTLQALVSALSGLLSGRLQLLALGLQRAGRGIVQIAALVPMAAVLAVTAWLALGACVALVLVTLGRPLLPSAWRTRVNPAAATAAASTVLAIARRLIGRPTR